MAQNRKQISRRRFMGQASCAAVGSTSLFSTLLNLRMANTAAAQSIEQTAGDYRALVCLFLGGGNDSFNMLVPRGAAEYADYAAIRQDLALPQNDLLAINPENDPGRALGLHPSMPELQQLFESGKLSFVANTGTLVEPTSLDQYENQTVELPLGLYSHSDQIRQWQTSIPQNSGSLGWGGRTSDLLHSLNDNARISMNISMHRTNVWQTGDQSFAYTITENGSTGLNAHEGSGGFAGSRGAAIDNQLDLEYRNLFEETFAKTNRDAIDAHLEFSAAIEQVPPLNTVFPHDNFVAQDLAMIARVIAARQTLGMNRQTFFIFAGGWDHHDEVIDAQNYMLAEVSRGIGAFYDAMVELGVSDKVTLFTASDFARTLTSNGRGSDHGWGGNHMVVGDAVLGRQIFGQYPDLFDGNALDTGRGRLIPTTSVDLYFAELARWLGVAESDLPTVLPNIERFHQIGSGAPLGFMQT